MKILFLNKEERNVLIKFLKERITIPGGPYELLSILEKLSKNDYEKLFQTMEVSYYGKE